MRLINADKLRDEWLYGTVGNEPEFTPNDVLESIDNQPTMDAVPVVRCKDCIFHDTVKDKISGTNFCFCKFHPIPLKTDENGFCHRGRSE